MSTILVLLKLGSSKHFHCMACGERSTYNTLYDDRNWYFTFQVHVYYVGARMNYITGTAAAIAIILFYKLFSERRRNSDNSNNSTSQQSNSTTISSEVVSGDSTLVSLPTGEYEVFLSFRGPDTRHHITDILYRFLVHLKIRTFRDDDELRKGEEIGRNLVQAIGQSKIYVPIISERYAHSKWCLKELVEIVQHHKQDQRHMILPIFYMVDPRDVRHQTGPYESAFRQHKKNKFDEATIQSWKDALKEVGALKGWHVKTKEEEAAIADLVSGDVWSHLSKTNNALVTDELVGIDEHIEQVVNRLSLDSQGVKVVGLHGIGGIGKTTLATAAYNKTLACFDRCSFLENIRETQQQSDGVLVLQRKLISNILRMESVGRIIDINEGLKIISERVSQFKILVVLDDVDDKFKFDEVLGNISKFVSGSRFIITSRNIKILRSLSKDPHNLYEVHGMDKDRSLKLFCRHAFKQDFPLLGFEALSKDIVSTTGGLPLTLKVVGSLLFLETEDIWKDKLEQLRKFPEEEVMKRLMISYNGLGYEAQQIFLDIACFYIGTKKEIPSYLWSDCNFHPVSCINLLIQRSMLKIGKENKFEMHDQLRDMGREIVRQENIEHPEMRSRIWSLEEGRDVLVNNKGTNQVRAIRAYSKYKFVVDRRCLTNMTELRYFDVEDAELIGDFSHVLPNLKWMHFKDMETTASFSMKNMVIFDAYRCPIQYIPTKEAKKLKFLQLGNCEKMSKFPEFPESLEMLYLRTFYNKEEDMELRNLHNLKVLKLQTCTLGRIKGGTVGTMKGLRELELSWIKCDFHSFRRVIADIGELSSLEILQFNSPALKDVLEGIQLPKSLKVLSTSSCFDNFSELLDLEDFSMTSTERMTELVSLPASKLKSIELYCKARIIMVEGHLNTMLPSSLTRVRVFHLQSDRIPNVKNLRNLTSLILAHCPNVQEIQGLGGLKSLQFLQVSNMEKLANIDGLGNLMSSSNCKLTDVRILSCPLLRALRTFEQHDEDDDDSNDAVRIESLFSLHIQGCPLMDCRSVPKLSKFPRLRKLSIGEIGSNINDESGSQRDHDQLLEGLDNLGEMVLLQVSGLAKLERLPCLSKLTKLTKLTVSNLPCLREIAGLGELKSLEWLKVAELPCLGEIAGLGELKSLKRLEVIGVRCLREIAGLGELKKSLKELVVRGCISLERFPVEDLPYSEMHYIELDLRGCTNFTNVDSDLSPLTTRAAELRRRVMLIIKWPNEPLSDES
ncbi:Disease resistance protein L6 [Linum grandiflorum]